MSVQVQFRRGNTAQHSVFTGAPGEITVDTDRKVIVVHDGLTVGGFPLASISSYDVANSAYSFANGVNTFAYGVAVNAAAAFAAANNVSPQIAPTRDTLNVAFGIANVAFDKANSANVLAYNTGIAANNYAGYMANSANAYAASLTPDLSPAFNKANGAYVVANSAYDYANTILDLIGTGFFNSTLTSFPTGNLGSGESYPVNTLDAFGVSLVDNYDCMDPTGSYSLVDLGVLT